MEPKVKKHNIKISTPTISPTKAGHFIINDGRSKMSVKKCTWACQRQAKQI